MVLAPDEIHAHPRLCAEAIPFGKPLFIDKTLAPTLAESQEIAEQASLGGVPFLASSALRHAIELDEALAETSGEITVAAARGYGAWSRYGVHTVALALRIMGPGFERLIDTGIGSAPNVTLDYGSDRRASVQVFDGTAPSKTFPWTFAIGFGDRYVGGKVEAYHEFYVNQLRATLDLFEAGETDMAAQEALDTVAVLELATISRQGGGVWVGRA
jgi:predicted dehydrogenase